MGYKKVNITDNKFIRLLATCKTLHSVTWLDLTRKCRILNDLDSPLALRESYKRPCVPRASSLSSGQVERVTEVLMDWLIEAWK